MEKKYRWRFLGLYQNWRSFNRHSTIFLQLISNWITYIKRGIWRTDPKKNPDPCSSKQHANYVQRNHITSIKRLRIRSSVYERARTNEVPALWIMHWGLWKYWECNTNTSRGLFESTQIEIWNPDACVKCLESECPIKYEAQNLSTKKVPANPNIRICRRKLLSVLAIKFQVPGQ